jgi:hypothetical protein
MANKKLRGPRLRGPFTAEPVPLATGTDALTDWIRLPKPRQRLGGLSRSTWNELLDSGKVRGLTLRKEKATRGIRLIHRPSAEQYLTSLMHTCKGEEHT